MIEFLFETAAQKQLVDDLGSGPGLDKERAALAKKLAKHVAVQWAESSALALDGLGGTLDELPLEGATYKAKTTDLAKKLAVVAAKVWADGESLEGIADVHDAAIQDVARVLCRKSRAEGEALGVADCHELLGKAWRKGFHSALGPIRKALKTPAPTGFAAHLCPFSGETGEAAWREGCADFAFATLEPSLCDKPDEFSLDDAMAVLDAELEKHDELRALPKKEAELVDGWLRDAAQSALREFGY